MKMSRIFKSAIICLAIEAFLCSELIFVFRNRIASNSHLLNFKSTSIFVCAVTCKTIDTCMSFTFNQGTATCILFSFCPDVSCDHMADDQGSETFCFVEQRLKDCKALQEAGYDQDGVYLLYPYGTCHVPVWAYCDMVTDDGGWTVFHRRMDGTVNFTQNWESYRQGFGNPTSEYWLGNAVIHQLTSTDPSSLYVKMKARSGTWKYARYSSFQITEEADSFRLSVHFYSGDAGDSLQSSWYATIHDGQKFSTYDSDNDGSSDTNCAISHHGGWWYNGCHATNLNGKYCGYPLRIDTTCNTWSTYNGSHLGLEQTIMMFRRH